MTSNKKKIILSDKKEKNFEIMKVLKLNEHEFDSNLLSTRIISRNSQLSKENHYELIKIRGKKLLPQKLSNFNSQSFVLRRKKNKFESNEISKNGNLFMYSNQKTSINDKSMNYKGNKIIILSKKLNSPKKNQIEQKNIQEISPTTLKMKDIKFDLFSHRIEKIRAKNYFPFSKSKSNNLKQKDNHKKINFVCKDKDYSMNKLKKKITNSTSNILHRKQFGDMPIIINAPITFYKNFKSNSEKERNQRNSLALIKLRDFLERSWNERHKIVADFFNSFQLKEDKFYYIKHLDNFANFICDNIKINSCIINGDIDTRMTMKNIAEHGIQYTNIYNTNNNSKIIKPNGNLDDSKLKKNKTTINFHKRNLDWRESLNEFLIRQNTDSKDEPHGNKSEISGFEIINIKNFLIGIMG